MARRTEGRTVSTLKQIESLRRRVQEARLARGPIVVNNALEYELLRRGLELLGNVIRAYPTTDPTADEGERSEE